MSDGWQFAARIQYPSANRGYEVKFAQEYSVLIWDMNSLMHERGIETGYWGPHVSIKAETPNQICWVSLALPKFMEAFGAAVSKITNLDFQEAWWTEGMSPSEKLDRKSEFLRHVSEKYPAMLDEIEQSLAVAMEAVQQGKNRVQSLKAKA